MPNLPIDRYEDNDTRFVCPRCGRYTIGWALAPRGCLFPEMVGAMYPDAAIGLGC